MLDATLPQLVGDSFSFRSNGSTKQLDVVANDTPGDSGELLIETVSQGDLGGFVQIAADGQSLIYHPFSGAEGVETFRYAVTGGVAAGVQVSLRAPVSADSYTVFEQSEPIRLPVMENDDLGSRFVGERRITAISIPSRGGSVEVADDGVSVWYTPDPDFSGFESFAYVVGEQISGTVGVHVLRLLGDNRFRDDGSVLSGIARTMNVLDNDPFADDYSGDRRITLVTTPGHGTAELSADGQSIVYTSEVGYSGGDRFHYVVDGRYEAAVTINVTSLTERDVLLVKENSGETPFDVLANDRLLTMLGSDAVIVTEITQPDHGGMLRIEDDGQTLIYEPAADFVGYETATYTLNGLYQQTVSFSVSAWPDSPDGSISILENSSAMRLFVLESSFFIPYQGEQVITGFSQPEHGSVAFNAERTDLLYTPAPGFTGTDNVAFIVDGDVHGTISIAVRSRAESESISVVISPELDEIALPVLANEIHIPDAVLTSVSAPESAAVDVRLSADGQKILVTPHEMLSRTVRIEYTVNGQYSAVTSLRLYPSVRLSGDRDRSLQNSSGTIIDPLANDRFGNATPRIFNWLTHNYVSTVFPYDWAEEITSVSSTEHGGTVTATADGKQLIYSPPADFSGTDSFEYVVDGRWTGTVTVDVYRATRDDAVSVLADSIEYPIHVLANDPLGSDYGGSGILTDVTQPVSGGSVTIGVDGATVLYTPPAGFSGEDSFTYRVDETQVATVTVQVGQSVDDLLDRFTSIDEFKDWLVESAVRRYSSSFDTVYFRYDLFMATGLSTGLTTSNSRTFSDTNVQVAGVDEADFVENDGEYLYVISGSDLIITQAWPVEELAEVSRLQLDGTPQGMYLSDGRLTIISETVEYENWHQVAVTRPSDPEIGRALTVDNAASPDTETPATLSSASADVMAGIGYWPIVPRPRVTGYNTVVTILGVSNPASPQLLRQTTIDAKYRDSRSIDGTLQLLTQRGNVQLPGPVPVPLAESDPLFEQRVQRGWHPVEGAQRYETEAEYRARISETIDDLVADAFPEYRTVGADGTETSGSLVDLSDLIHLGGDSASKLLSVVSLKTDSALASPIAAETLLTSATSTVYATPNHLYVLGVAPESETGISRADDGSATHIRRFDWDNESGGIELSAIGAVPGTPIDEFALDEFDGQLRIATSVRRATVTGSRLVTDLYVLDAKSNLLTPVGAALDVARGDSLKSVRYHGDIAVAATFDGSSPLHVIDLSDPHNPALAGETRTVGYPSYMQFVDDSHLLTIGRNSVGRYRGPTQVSLLDLTDPLNPRVIDQDTLPRFSTSVAESDHHAFGWFGYHSVLAVPTSRSYSVRTDEDGDGYRESREMLREDTLYAFQIDTSFGSRSEDAISLNGTVDHDAAILRSAFIDDVLYSVGDGLIHAVNLHDPTKELASAALAYSPVEVPMPEVWRTIVLDAADFQLAALQADVIAPPTASIGISNRVLEIDLTEVPAADAAVIRDKQSGELVVRYRSTALNTEPVEQRFSLRDVGRIRVTLGSGDDRIDLSRAFRSTTVFGGAGNDSIIGGARYDELHGQAGDDVLQGRRGVDRLFGEGGDDQLSGQQYNDWMYGGAGNDTLMGNNGNDVLNGGTGADFLNGGRGRSRLADQVDGNVTLAAAGYDTGRGDVARGVGARGRLEIIGGDGNEVINASGYRGGGVVVNGGGGDDTLIGSRGDDTLIGSRGDDTLIGSRGDDSLDGGAGDDVIRGGAGHDTLFGNLGNDRLRGQGGIDELGGGLGDDRIDGGGGASIIREQADANYSLSGDRNGVSTKGIGNDRWIGSYVQALLYGGESDNLIDASGFDGRVGVFGGAGNDIVATATKTDLVEPGDGEDIVIRGGRDHSAIVITHDRESGPVELERVTHAGLQFGFRDAAERAGVPVESVTLVEVIPNRFNDGCLDLPGRNACTLALVDGVIVRFKAASRIYRYHAGRYSSTLAFAATERTGFPFNQYRSNINAVRIVTGPADPDSPFAVQPRSPQVNLAISDALLRLYGLTGVLENDRDIRLYTWPLPV